VRNDDAEWIDILNAVTQDDIYVCVIFIYTPVYHTSSQVSQLICGKGNTRRKTNILCACVKQAYHKT